MIRAISWIENAVVMIDQKSLPHEIRYITCHQYEEVIAAIKDMTVRGAPAVGIAAAMGIALGVLNISHGSEERLKEDFYTICTEFSKTRPTAVNLFWAIKRMKECFESNLEADFEIIKKSLVEKAILICEEDADLNRQMGMNGRRFIKDRDSILTHCNAGALATGGYGTALGVIRAAHKEGKTVHVFVDETRPLLQGARLTAWELVEENIPATLITDSMAGAVMRDGRVNLVIVGADRIAANGDVANKIGTYTLAVLAKENKVPFYVAAPLSTIDRDIKNGGEIPIEEREETEVLNFGGVRTAPEGISVYNPAFDVTPSCYVTAIITEAGVVTPPYEEAIKKLFRT